LPSISVPTSVCEALTDGDGLFPRGSFLSHLPEGLVTVFFANGFFADAGFFAVADFFADAFFAMLLGFGNKLVKGK